MRALKAPMQMIVSTEAQARAEARARATKARMGYAVYRHRHMPDTFTVVPRAMRVTKRVWQFVIGISPSKIKS